MTRRCGTSLVPSAMFTQVTNSLIATSSLALQSPAQSWASAAGTPPIRSINADRAAIRA
jgi:hypothetical protein